MTERRTIPMHDRPFRVLGQDRDDGMYLKFPSYPDVIIRVDGGTYFSVLNALIKATGSPEICEQALLHLALAVSDRRDCGPALIDRARFERLLAAGRVVAELTEYDPHMEDGYAKVDGQEMWLSGCRFRDWEGVPTLQPGDLDPIGYH